MRGSATGACRGELTNTCLRVFQAFAVLAGRLPRGLAEPAYERLPLTKLETLGNLMDTVVILRQVLPRHLEA